MRQSNTTRFFRSIFPVLSSLYLYVKDYMNVDLWV